MGRTFSGRAEAEVFAAWTVFPDAAWLTALWR
jgi:hypothetical protein